jgi:hypothetical protein
MPKARFLCFFFARSTLYPVSCRRSHSPYESARFASSGMLLFCCVIQPAAFGPLQPIAMTVCRREPRRQTLESWVEETAMNTCSVCLYLYITAAMTGSAIGELQHAGIEYRQYCTRVENSRRDSRSREDFFSRKVSLHSRSLVFTQ